MLSPIYLVALIALLANVHSARGAQCIQGNDSTYNISSQSDFDAIIPCELSIPVGTTDGIIESYIALSGINGELNIESNYTGGLDLGINSFVMGSVRATDNPNMLGIEGQNLNIIGLGNPNVNGLVLQNLSSFNYLRLPALNSTGAISLSSLPKLHSFSLPAFANYNYSTVFVDGAEEAYYMNLTIDNTSINSIEGVGIAEMGAISITNNLNLETVDLGTLDTLQGNLTFFNNGPSLSLNLTNLRHAVAIQLSNVDSVDISMLQQLALSIQITNNTFTSINVSSLEDFGTAGLLVSDNENLKSLDIGVVYGNPTTSALEIYDNPQLVLTDSSFDTLSIEHITINSIISGGNLFPSLGMLSNSSIIHITSINTPQSGTTFSCTYLDSFVDQWTSPPTNFKITKATYSCASYASATSQKDIAAHYVAPKGRTHLSRGADVGIAIAVVCACVLVTALCFVRRRKRHAPKPVEEDGDELPSYERHAEQPPAYRGTDDAVEYIAGTTGGGLEAVPVPAYEEVGVSGGDVRSVGVEEVGDGDVEHGTGLERGDEHGVDGATAHPYRVSEESVRDRQSSVRGDGRVSMEGAENVHHAVSGG